MNQKKYISYFFCNQKHATQWLTSINYFKNFIDSQPILRMNWEHGISQCKQLKNKSGDDVLDMINTICRTPPSFSNHALVGFPLNIVFLELAQNPNGRAFFSNQKVNKHLKQILNDYAKFLQSPDSLKYLTEEKQLGWLSKQANDRIHNQWFKCNPHLLHYGYKSWNDWFIREFKDGLRLIGNQTPQNINAQQVIINSCESSPTPIPVQPQYNCKLNDNFWIKDNKYSLSDMFGARKYNKQHLVQHFIGGTVYQAFLSTMDYHRWHAPVDGIIQDIYQIDGTYYFDQSQFIPFDAQSPKNSECFLTAVATRKVIVIKANNVKIGKLAIIYVGMAEVSSCVSTVKIGDTVKKGQQLGYFMFGGSTHVIIFQKNARLNFGRSQQFYRKLEDNSLEPVKQNVNSYLAHVL